MKMSDYYIVYMMVFAAGEMRMDIIDNIYKIIAQRKGNSNPLSEEEDFMVATTICLAVNDYANSGYRTQNGFLNELGYCLNNSEFAEEDTE